MFGEESADSIAFGLPGVRLSPGDHICAFYRGAEGRDEVLLAYLRAGIEAGDRCVAVLDQVEPEQLRASLSQDRIDPVRGVDVLRSDETYLRDGRFSKTAMIEFWDSATRENLSSGDYTFARSCGEMTWALREVPGVEDLVDYESDLNRFLPMHPQVIMCLYDLDRFDGRGVVDLLRTHPKLLLCGSLLDNPYYLEPDEFLAAKSKAPVI